MSRRLSIPESFLESIRLQAIREYPAECCGLLLGNAGTEALTRVFPCRNAQDLFHRTAPKDYPRTSRTAYLLHPEDLMRINAQLAKTTERIAAIYHSHIDKDAYFSEKDFQDATYEENKRIEPSYPSTAYLVLSVKKMDGAIQVADQKLFCWDTGKRRFEEGEIC